MAGSSQATIRTRTVSPQDAPDHETESGNPESVEIWAGPRIYFVPARQQYENYLLLVL